MSRLRQYYANRYTSSEATNAEFENLMRYINAAELGNLTIGELMAKLFDANGDLSLGLDFRYDPSTGIEFLSDPDSENWELLVAAEDLRGAPGLNIGNVESPLLSNRVDITAGVAQTVYPYTMTSGAATVMVWVNGVLQAASAVTVNTIANTVTLAVAPATSATVTISSIRTSPSTAYRRVDLVAAAGQVTFPFAHTANEELIVFRNGIFQREGGGYDYIKSPTTATVTMTTSQTAGAIITIICITNALIRDVAGIMLEDRYATNGFLRLDRIAIADDAITQNKISGLVTALAGKAKMTVAATAPGGAAYGDLWINTSTAVPSLLFYDSIRWLSASPNGLVPLPQAANALQFLRLNSTATALEYSSFDTTGLVPTSQIGLANGVAPLNSSGKLPSTVLPDYSLKSPIIGKVAGSITNSTVVVAILEGAAHTITGFTAKLDAGTATLQLAVGGVNVGSTLACSTTTTKLAITSIVKDASVTPLDVSIVITGASSASGLTFHVANSITA
jgi:hypothetical protein